MPHNRSRPFPVAKITSLPRKHRLGSFVVEMLYRHRFAFIVKRQNRVKTVKNSRQRSKTTTREAIQPGNLNFTLVTFFRLVSKTLIISIISLISLVSGSHESHQSQKVRRMRLRF